MTLNRRMVIALGITALLGAAVVQAEELGRTQVPFAFEARGQSLEAGTYSAVDNGGILLVRNIVTGHGAYLLPVQSGLTNSGQSSMIFRCYGSDCFLNKIQFGGTRRVYEIHPSKREKELAQIELAQVTLIAMR